MAKNAFIETASKETLEGNEKVIAQLDVMLERMGVLETKAKKIQFPNQSKKFIKEVNDELKKGTKIMSDAEKNSKKLKTSQDNLAFSQSKLGKEVAKNREETRKQNAENKKSLSSWGKLQLALNKAEEKYRNLAASLSTSAIQTKKAKAQVDRLRTSIDNINKPIGRFGDNVGNYPGQLKGATKALRSFVAAFGLTSGIFLFVQVLRDGFKSVRDFGKSMQNLAGILGEPREELRGLEDAIIDVAGKSVNTATEVAKLAEALVTLGKTKSEVKDLLEPVNNLAIGLETTSENAGELLVKTLNAFGEASSEGQRYADIIAKIRTSTALDFEKIKDSLAFIAPTAKAAGVSFEQTGALLGTLVDNGIKAERAGRLLSTSFLRLAGNGKTLDQGLDQLGTSSDSALTQIERLALASDVFGKNAGPLALILAENRGKVDELTESFGNAGGTLEGLVNEQLKSLDASLLILKSRWEEYILRSNQAGGFSSKLAKIINFLSDNLDKILDTIIDVGQAFFIYKGIMIATALITRAYAAGTVVLRIAKIALSGGIKAARIEMQAFNVASKANPIGILISVVAAGVATWYAFADSVKASAEALKNARDEADKIRESIVRANIALVQEQIKRIDEEVSNEKKATEEKIKFLKKEIEARKNGSKLLDEVKESSDKEESERRAKLLKDIQDFEDKQFEEDENEIDRIKRKTKEKITGINQLTEATKESSKVNLSVNTKEVVGDLSGQKETIKELDAILKDLQKTIKNLNKKPEDPGVNNQLLKDSFSLQKQRLQFEINAAKEISNNENESLENRLLANQDFVKKKQELSLLEKDFAISQAKGRTSEIVRVEENAENEKTKAAEEGQKNRDKIFESDFKSRFESAKLIQDDFERRLEEDTLKLEEELLKQGASRSEIGAKVDEFVDQERRGFLDKQINLLETELLAVATTAEQRILIEKEIARIKGEIVVSDLNKALTAEQKKQQAIRQTQQLLGSLSELYTALSDGRIQKIEQEQETVNNRFETELENEKLTDEQRKSIEDQQARRNEEYEQKKAEEARKTAIFNKAIAIAQIAIETAQAIAAASKLTIGAPAAIAFAIAQGVAQSAIVAATPIPQYAEGKKHTDSYQGKMLYGEVPGKTEIQMGKDGSIKGVASKPTIGYTEKGDTIFKSIPEFQKYMVDNSFMGSALMNSGYLPPLINVKSIQKNENKELYGQIKKEINQGFKKAKINTSYKAPDIDLSKLLTLRDRIG